MRKLGYYPCMCCNNTGWVKPTTGGSETNVETDDGRIFTREKMEGF